MIEVRQRTLRSRGDNIAMIDRMRESIRRCPRQFVRLLICINGRCFNGGLAESQVEEYCNENRDETPVKGSGRLNRFAVPHDVAPWSREFSGGRRRLPGRWSRVDQKYFSAR